MATKYFSYFCVLSSKGDLPINFEVEDSIAKLVDLNLVTSSKDTHNNNIYTACEPEEALKRLEQAVHMLLELKIIFSQ